MTEEIKEESPPKKKGIFGKLKESVDDREEQLAILSTFSKRWISDLRQLVLLMTVDADHSCGFWSLCHFLS